MIYKCRECSTILTPNVNWYAKGADNKNFICNNCRKIYYNKNKARINAQSKAWRLRNKEKVKLAQKKARVKNADYYKNYNLQIKYGITLEDFYKILAVQNYSCAICGTHSPGGRNNTFHVDHDHDTGEVRGLLCHHCNTALGKFKDDPEILKSAILYLEKKYG